MLFDWLFKPGIGDDIVQVVCAIDELIDVKRFAEAAKNVISARPVLHTQFEWCEPNEPTQMPVPVFCETMTFQDWSKSTAIQQSKKLESFLEADRSAGFNLYSAPLIRFALFRRARNRHWIALTFHHIILDGRSAPLVLKDLLDAYRHAGSVAISDQPRFSEYVRWFGNFDVEAASTFWKQKLAPPISPSLLMSIVGKHSPEKGTMHSIAIHLDRQKTAAIAGVAARTNTTLALCIHAAWAVLVSRYLDQDDVVMGTVRGIMMPRDATKLGLMINTLPLRIRICPQESLSEFIIKLHDEWIQSWFWSRMPLSKLHAIAGEESLHGLFDALIVYQHESLETAVRRQNPEWNIGRCLSRVAPRYPIILHAEGGPRLKLDIRFSTSHLNRFAAARMVSHLKNLLVSMAQAIDQPIGQWSIFSDKEHHLILNVWNNTSRAFPRDKCLHELFEEQVQIQPNAIATVGGGEPLTYSELDRYANRIAHHLITLGVEKGSAVGVRFARGPDLIAAMLAVLKLGASYVPLHPDWPAARIDVILKTARARLILSHSHLPSIGDDSSLQFAARINIDTLDSITNSDANFRSRASSSDVAYIIFTSGSTGVPKGVAVQHQACVNVIDWVNRQFQIGSKDTILFVTSPAFDLSVYDIFGMLAAGGRIRIADDKECRDPLSLLNILQSESITFWDSAPAFFEQICALFPDRPQILGKTLRLVFLSGDWIPVTLPQSIKSRFPLAKIVALGGATEAAIWSNWYEVNDVDPNWNSIPYGRPIQNTRYYILDSRLQPCPIGVEGALYIGGDCLAKEYVSAPELTAERFIPDPFVGHGHRIYKTGDRALFLADGNIEFRGRSDRQVKIRGFRIELEEIEHCLRRHPDVREALVDVSAENRSNNPLHAYIVPAKETTIDFGALQLYLQQSLPHYMIPSVWKAIDLIPLTVNGKVDRQSLRKLADNLNENRDFEPPNTEAERALASIWSLVLGVKGVGRDDNFFALGGDSLSTIRVATMASALGWSIGPQQLVELPTLRDLAQAMRRNQNSPIVKSDQGSIVPLIPIQHWFFSRQLLDPHNYNAVFMFDVSPDVSAQRINAAWQQIIGKHDVFRLCFTRAASGWEQKLLESVESFQYIDLRENPVHDQWPAAEAVMFRLRSKLELGIPPLAKLVVFDLKDRRYFGLLIHHLIFDAVSLRILLEEICNICEGANSTHAHEASLGFCDWARLLSADAICNVSKRDLNGWLALPWHRVQPIPIDLPGAGNTYGTTSVARSSLGAELTKTLTEAVPRHFAITANEVLLRAFGMAIADWADIDAALVDVTGHGRETYLDGVNIAGTIGYLNCISPAIFDRSTQEISSRPRELSWGVLRYLSGSDFEIGRLQSLPIPEIKFNYMGNIDSLSPRPWLKWVPNSIPGVLHPDNVRGYLLNMELRVRNGCLHIECKYSRAQFHHERILELIECYSARLKSSVLRLPGSDSKIASGWKESGQ